MPKILMPMLADPNTVCVDMRNHYESEIGHFDGAVNSRCRYV